MGILVWPAFKPKAWVKARVEADFRFRWPHFCLTSRAPPSRHLPNDPFAETRQKNVVGASTRVPFISLIRRSPHSPQATPLLHGSDNPRSEDDRRIPAKDARSARSGWSVGFNWIIAVGNMAGSDGRVEGAIGEWHGTEDVHPRLTLQSNLSRRRGTDQPRFLGGSWRVPSSCRRSASAHTHRGIESQLPTSTVSRIIRGFTHHLLSSTLILPRLSWRQKACPRRRANRASARKTKRARPSSQKMNQGSSNQRGRTKKRRWIGASIKARRERLTPRLNRCQSPETPKAKGRRSTSLRKRTRNRR